MPAGHNSGSRTPRSRKGGQILNIVASRGKTRLATVETRLHLMTNSPEPQDGPSQRCMDLQPFPHPCSHTWTWVAFETSPVLCKFRAIRLPLRPQTKGYVSHGAQDPTVLSQRRVPSTNLLGMLGNANNRDAAHITRKGEGRLALTQPPMLPSLLLQQAGLSSQPGPLRGCLSLLRQS